MPISIVFREVCERRIPYIYPLLRYGCRWQPADASGSARLHPLQIGFLRMSGRLLDSVRIVPPAPTVAPFGCLAAVEIHLCFSFVC
jgi:hypothetical protein